MTMQTGNRYRLAWRCALPAILLSALVLLPFLNSPFTIDDPIFLQEADHLLSDPLHPQSTELVWSFDVMQRASQMLPGGAAAPYFLIPAVLAGNAEWAAHLTQFVLLALALFGTALAALRLGLDRRGAAVSALLVASAPAVLGMAITAMPDIPTLTCSVLGMERVLAWREQRKWHQGVLAAVWLALASLTRAHTVFLLPAAAVFLLDGLAMPEIRSSLRNFRRFVPLAAVPVLFVLVTWITADPDTDNTTQTVLPQLIRYHLRPIAINLCGYLVHWCLTAPLTLYWLWVRWRSLSWPWVIAAFLSALSLTPYFGTAPILAGATGLVLLDLFRDAIRRKDRDQLALGLWLLPPLSIVMYVHMPCKYIVPLMPAAGILLARLLPQARAASRRWLPAAAVAGGLAVGLLVLVGIRDLARVQQRAARELIPPLVAAGERVWFTGHWGFHYYAEQAGARAAVLVGEVPKPGDVVVVSRIDDPLFGRLWKQKKVLRRMSYYVGGRVMDLQTGAGFFSTMNGRFWPWTWSSGEANVYEVWRIE